MNRYRKKGNEKQAKRKRWRKKNKNKKWSVCSQYSFGNDMSWRSIVWQQISYSNVTLPLPNHSVWGEKQHQQCKKQTLVAAEGNNGTVPHESISHITLYPQWTPTICDTSTFMLDGKSWQGQNSLQDFDAAGSYVSVYWTTALLESPPPAQLHPQLQRLPNGYSLISALWSSTAPLGRGLERLQECACMSVFILHCFSICTVTGEHPLTQASSELFITDCTVLPGNTVTPTDIWHFTVVCRVSHLMYGSAKSFLLRMSEAFIMFVDHKISIILRNILHPLNITLYYTTPY